MASQLLGILLAVLLLVSADLTSRLVAPVQAPADSGDDRPFPALRDDDDDFDDDEDEDEADDDDDEYDDDDEDDDDDDDLRRPYSPRDDDWMTPGNPGGESLDGSGVTRGPYLQLATPGAITIRWRTGEPVRSLVRYGTSPERLEFRSEGRAATQEHEVRLTGLRPDTRYHYSVGSPESAPAGGSFRTSPPVGTERRTRIWIIGDSGLRGRGQQRVQDAYDAFSNAAPIDVWLLLGDNAYTTGTFAQYQAGFFAPYRERLRSTVVWPARGNHDEIRNGANNDYYDFFTLPRAGEAGGTPSGTEAWFSFDHANIHFVCLDAEQLESGAGDGMIAWLRRDLAATRQDWLIAYLHHPPYSRGSHDSDKEGVMIQARKRLVPVLEDAGADLVVAVHSHSYERSYLLDGHYGPSTTLRQSMVLDRGNGRPDGDGAYRKATYGRLAPHEGTVYAVIGSSAKLSSGRLDHRAHLRSLGHLGSLVVDVSGPRLDAAFVDENRRVGDRFTILKGQSPLSQRVRQRGEPAGARAFGGLEP
jgi:hypothetical protein